MIGRPRERQVYPYSVISGGAHSAGDLKAAIAADPVVASHYQGFDVGRTRVMVMDRARTAYLSYRIHNAVYWTKKPVVVPAGELVLTDGARMARTRCGNQLSDVPGETSDEEPAPGVMDVPVTPLSLLPPHIGTEPAVTVTWIGARGVVIELDVAEQASLKPVRAVVSVTSTEPVYVVPPVAPRFI